jgi:hypothetical protein
MTSLFDGENIEISEDYVLQDNYTINSNDYYIKFVSDNVTFDGNGKTITLDNIELCEGIFYNEGYSYITVKNLIIDVKTDNLIGKYTNENGSGYMCRNRYGKNGTENKFENCTIQNAYINSRSGAFGGSYLSNLSFTNCVVYGTLGVHLHKVDGQSSSTFEAYTASGMITEYCNSITMRHCQFVGDIDGAQGATGIIGNYATNCIIEDCVSECNILRGTVLEDGTKISESLVDEDGENIDLSNKNVVSGQYIGIPITTVTGNGSGLKLNIHVDYDKILTSPSTAMYASGFGYRMGDILQIDAGNFGPNSEEVQFTLQPNSFTSSHNSRNASGIAGSNGNNNTINRCTFKGNILGHYCSGIAGSYTKLTTISRCVFQGTSYTTNDGTVYPSGLILSDSSGICGTWGSDNIINDCTCNVSLIGGGDEDFGPSASRGNKRASGILGLYNFKARVFGCTTSAETLRDSSGGVVAMSNQGVVVENCHFIGQDLYDDSGGLGGRGIDQNIESIDEDTEIITRSTFIDCTTKCRNMHNNSGGILGAYSKYTDVSNCTVEVVDIEDAEGGNIGLGGLSNGAGGIGGKRSFYLHIDNCYVKCNSVEGKYSGGILGGDPKASLVENSYVITKSGFTGERSGGIFGGHGQDNAVVNSYVVGDVRGSRSGAVFGAYAKFTRSTDNTNTFIDMDASTFDTFANIKRVYVVGDVLVDNTIDDEGFVGAYSSDTEHIVDTNSRIDSTWSDINSSSTLSNVEVLSDGTSPNEDTIFVSRGTEEPYTLTWELFLSFAESDTIKNIVASSISVGDSYSFTGNTTDPNDFDVDFEVEIKLEGIQLEDLTTVQQDNLVTKLKQSYASFYQRDISSIIVTLSAGSVIIHVEVYKSSVPQEIEYSVNAGINPIGFSIDTKIKGHLDDTYDSIDRIYECDGQSYTEINRGPDYFYTFTAGKGYFVITKDDESLTQKFYGESTTSATIQLNTGWNYIGSSVDGGNSSDSALSFYYYNNSNNSYELLDNTNLPKDKCYIVHSTVSKEITVA